MEITVEVTGDQSSSSVRYKKVPRESCKAKRRNRAVLTVDDTDDLHQCALDNGSTLWAITAKSIEVIGDNMNVFDTY